MKKLGSIYTLIVGILLFASCSNDLPTFNDKDAFIAFTSPAMAVGEEKGKLDVPVLLASLSGISTTVDFEIVTEGSTAIAGKHFNVKNSSSTLTFTKEAPTQYINLEIIDNTTFDGDVKFSIKLKDPKGVNLGDSKVCDITIEDDEHPLLFILGRLTANAESYFNGATEWTVTIEKDETDLDKVWISNLVPDGSGLKVYATVSADKTEIRIPVKQAIAPSTASRPHVLLNGFYGPEPNIDLAKDIPTGGYISGTISEDGKITLLDWFGAEVFTDEAATASGGWYNIIEPGAVMKK